MLCVRGSLHADTTCLKLLALAATRPSETSLPRFSSRLGSWYWRRGAQHDDICDPRSSSAEVVLVDVSLVGCWAAMADVIDRLVDCLLCADVCPLVLRRYVAGFVEGAWPDVRGTQASYISVTWILGTVIVQLTSPSSPFSAHFEDRRVGLPIGDHTMS